MFCFCVLLFHFISKCKFWPFVLYQARKFIDINGQDFYNECNLILLVVTVSLEVATLQFKTSAKGFVINIQFELPCWFCFIQRIAYLENNHFYCNHKTEVLNKHHKEKKEKNILVRNKFDFILWVLSFAFKLQSVYFSCLSFFHAILFCPSLKIEEFYTILIYLCVKLRTL